MNSEQLLAIELLSADPRRTVYEAGARLGRAGTGQYYVDYSAGRSPQLTQHEVDELVATGWLVPEPRCAGLFRRGPKLK